MRVLFDIGHPAHVHLFRNARQILLDRGHKVNFVARKKDVTYQLLDAYNIDYTPGSIRRSGWKRGIELFEWFWIVRSSIKRLDINIVASIGSVAAAWASKLCGVPHLAFNDTETATKQRSLYLPATEKIITPACCLKDYGSRQIRYEGLHDLAYLRPEHFTPDPEVKKELRVGKEEKYVIFRFVSWDAIHDWGKDVAETDLKHRLVKRVVERARVFISAEGVLPQDLEPLRMSIPPHRLHDAMAFAAAVVGDGSTTATEAAVLGVPSLYISTFADSFGYIKLLKSYGLIDAVKTLDEGIEILQSILDKPDTYGRAKRREKLLAETIDVAKYIADMCEEYGNPKNRGH